VKSGWTYVVLAIGVAPVACWAVAVAMRVKRGEVVPDTW